MDAQGRACPHPSARLRFATSSCGFIESRTHASVLPILQQGDQSSDSVTTGSTDNSAGPVSNNAAAPLPVLVGIFNLAGQGTAGSDGSSPVPAIAGAVNDNSQTATPARRSPGQHHDGQFDNMNGPMMAGQQQAQAQNGISTTTTVAGVAAASPAGGAIMPPSPDFGCGRGGPHGMMDGPFPGWLGWALDDGSTDSAGQASAGSAAAADVPQ